MNIGDCRHITTVSWDDWLNLEIEGDRSLVDAAVRAALPEAAKLWIEQVRPIPFEADQPELIRPV